MKENEQSSSEAQSESSDQSKEEPCEPKKQRKKQPDFRKKQNIASLSHLIINVGTCQYETVRCAATELGFKIESDPEAAHWDLYWTDSLVEGELVLKMSQHQKINHFPGIQNLTRKNLLGKNLMRMRKQFPGEFQFFPLTWLIPSEYNEFRLYVESRPKGKVRTFIVKPEGGCQGRGIFLTRDIEEVEGGRHYVVQRYLTRPFLLEGLKFDLRLYVLITSVSPLRMYLYKEGLARFATCKYENPTEDNLDDLYMHLTNYAINKHNPNFIKNVSSEESGVGHKRSYSAVLESIRAKGQDVEALEAGIEDVIVKTVISSVSPIAHMYRAYQPQNLASDLCFHIIGVDIILNQECQPVLLEMNHTPSFTADTPLDKKVKLSLLRDTIQMLGMSLPRKARFLQQQQEIARLRNFTAKRVKLPLSERLELRQAKLALRFQHEDSYSGGYRRIFPPKKQQLMKKYESFYDFAERHYFQSAGFKRRFQQSEQTTCTIRELKDKDSRLKGSTCPKKVPMTASVSISGKKQAGRAEKPKQLTKGEVQSNNKERLSVSIVQRCRQFSQLILPEEHKNKFTMEFEQLNLQGEHVFAGEPNKKQLPYQNPLSSSTLGVADRPSKFLRKNQNQPMQKTKVSAKALVREKEQSRQAEARQSRKGLISLSSKKLTRKEIIDRLKIVPECISISKGAKM